ncbi:hypothetical protein DFH05DRAFT_685292 [Lentinula detonsa]|uniref:F-box domain-containing protein n=3 Tax=Lentinula detonsa TaxID=2804962 RepID=A0A9W8P9C2_9AGAR|nr:hypothetical protein DFH05DRAFT_685292 [Lentinula detonsa]
MVENFRPHLNIGSQSLQEHLRSPYGLSGNQLSKVAQFIRLADDDLNGYDAEIMRLEAKVVYLKSERERLLDHQATLSSLLSPIHHLPNEILTRIFTFACDKNHLYRSPSSPLSFTLNLSAVCSRWRASCLSCSELWANFKVTIYSGFNERYLCQLEYILDIFLERSKPQPLTIHIEMFGSMEHPLLRKLTRCSTRWREIILDAPCYSDTMFPCLSGLQLPELRSACIGKQPVDQPVMSLDLFTAAPKLRTLGSLSRELAWTDTAPLSQITHLTYSPCFANLHQVLELCPQLKTLYLSNYEFECDSGLDSGPPKQVSIDSLTIYLARHYSVIRDTLKDTMDSLSAPALTSLVLAQQSDPQENGRSPRSPFKTIDDFLVRSACPLIVLVLDGIPLMDHEVVALLKWLPSLVELTITESQFKHPPLITSDFVESLHSHRRSALRSSVNPILPKLQTLVLGTQSTALDFERDGISWLLMEVIVSRWLPEQSYAASIGVSCLRSMELYLSSYDEIDQFDRLEPYQKSGLRFVVGENRIFDY